MAYASLFTEEQTRAIEGGISKQERIVMASAGTGKTGVIAEIKRRLGKACMVVTPTHKTALVLMDRGIEDVHLIKGLTSNKFTQRKVFENNVTHLIVDEAGMVSAKDIAIIEGWIKENVHQPLHIMYFGDPCQLDPISDGADGMPNIWFPDQRADIVFTKNFRQSEDFKLRVVRDAKINPDSITICMTNETRTLINIQSHVEKHGVNAFTSKKKAVLQIHPGDKLVCYKTDQHNQTYRKNCIYTVKSIEDHPKQAGCFKVFFEGKKNSIAIKKSVFSVAKLRDTARKEKRDWELAYAVTCHTAQGSEFDNVIVYIERNEVVRADGSVGHHYPLRNANVQKWVYTAITRGMKSVLIVDPTNAIGQDGISIDIKIKTRFNVTKMEPTRSVPVFAAKPVIIEQDLEQATPVVEAEESLAEDSSAQTKADQIAAAEEAGRLAKQAGAEFIKMLELLKPSVQPKHEKTADQTAAEKEDEEWLVAFGGGLRSKRKVAYQPVKKPVMVEDDMTAYNEFMMGHDDPRMSPSTFYEYN